MTILGSSLLNVTQKIAYDEQLRSRRKRAAVSHRKPPWAAIVPIAIVVVFLLIVLIIKQGGTARPDGNLIIRWPADEREGAAVFERLVRERRAHEGELVVVRRPRTRREREDPLLPPKG